MMAPQHESKLLSRALLNNWLGGILIALSTFIAVEITKDHDARIQNRNDIGILKDGQSSLRKDVDAHYLEFIQYKGQPLVKTP